MNFKRKIRNFIKFIGKSPIVFNTIGYLAFLYTWFVGKTSSFDISGQEEFINLIDENDGGIFVTWHGRALMLPYFWENKRTMKALVSPHNDGRIIARLLKGYKILSIDGSTDRRSVEAALEIKKELNNGTVVALISDGPRGPSMRLNKSVIYFAQKTGKPVMGFTYSVRGAKILGSWDSMIVPLPFCKGIVKGTKPLFVPADATDDELEKIRKDFEDELNALTFEIDKKCGLPEILPGKTSRDRKMERNMRKGARE